MRFLSVFPALVAFVSADIKPFTHPHMEPLSLVQLGLEEKPVDMATLRKAAQKKFVALMQEAENKASHDPAVLKAHEAVRVSEAKFAADSKQATGLLMSIKERMNQSKKDISVQEKNAAIEAKKIRKFVEEENSKLEATEKKFMELQQKKITASFAELPVHVDTSSLLQKSGDNSKAQQKIHAAEKALSELDAKIKKRVETLTHMLNTPGQQFPGEVVL